MTRVYLALGSNLGDRERLIARAVMAVSELPGTRTLAQSSLIETHPVGPIPQGKYLNGVLSIETSLLPRELLTAILSIEAGLGRDRTQSPRWGPRTIDLDILLFGDLQLNEPCLILPHPRLVERRFVLAPLAELAPDLVVPGTGASVRELLKRLDASENAPCS